MSEFPKAVPLMSKHPIRMDGFTLIELIAVVVVIAILAIVAIPQFLDLRYDSKVAGLEGARAALRTAASLGHTRFLVANGDVSLADQFISVNGQNVRFQYGWPAASADGIMSLVTFIGYTGASGGCGANCWFLSYSSESSWCNAHYVAPSGAGQQPAYGLNSATC